MREEATRVHLIGAAGAGMVALAHLLLDRGARVTATDRAPGAAAARLRERGVELRAGGTEASLPEDVERVVHSLAVPDDDPERNAARARGLPDVSYPEAVAALLETRRGVGIAGTHGKTTTSAMVAHGLRRAGERPSWLVGGEAIDLGRPGGAGEGDLLVVEACEYRSSFLRYRLALGLVLNVEADHLDWFGTEAAVEAAFREFAARAETLVIGAGAAERLGRSARGRSSTRTFALDGPADVRAAGLREESGRVRFRVEGAVETPEIVCAAPGRAFAEDVLAAAATLGTLGVAGGAIAVALSEFRGVGRRMETILDGPVAFVSDYGHHPTEIRSVAAALRSRFPGRRLVAAFEPHQARRTLDFLRGFGAALAGFDRVFVADVFAAREAEEVRRAATAERLAEVVREAGGDARATGDLAATGEAILEEARAGDVILLLGAGTIDGLRHDLELPLSRP